MRLRRGDLKCVAAGSVAVDAVQEAISGLASAEETRVAASLALILELDQQNPGSDEWVEEWVDKGALQVCINLPQLTLLLIGLCLSSSTVVRQFETFAGVGGCGGSMLPSRWIQHFQHADRGGWHPDLQRPGGSQLCRCAGGGAVRPLPRPRRLPAAGAGGGSAGHPCRQPGAIFEQLSISGCHSCNEMEDSKDQYIWWKYVLIGRQIAYESLPALSRVIEVALMGVAGGS